MKVKIIKCNSDVWYKDRIGETFEINDSYNDRYYEKGTNCGILKSDCEIIPDEKKYESVFPEPINVLKTDVYLYAFEGERFQIIFVNGEWNETKLNFKNPYTREQWHLLSQIDQLIIHLELKYISKELE